MDLTSKFREEVALILIKAGVEYLENTVAYLHFPRWRHLEWPENGILQSSRIGKMDVEKRRIAFPGFYAENLAP